MDTKTERLRLVCRLRSEHLIAGICFLGGAAVAASGHDGWGWLMFIGFCCI
jgi:hypothetical protein